MHHTIFSLGNQTLSKLKPLYKTDPSQVKQKCRGTVYQVTVTELTISFQDSKEMKENS